VIKENQKTKYFPMLAGVVDDDLFSEEENQKWERKHTLPQKTQDILTSNKIVDFIYGVEQRYHLQDAQTEEFSRTVRRYFFREITEAGFAQKISALCRISPDKALELLQAIKAIEPKNTDENEVNYIQLPLSEAIKKYPQILKQIITSRNIITKPFLKPLKPTVKNWIMVYEKILDVSKHNTIERGEFVFRSKATQGLNKNERKILLILFKSRDEDYKLTIDIDSEKIVFENIVEQVNSIPAQNKIQQSQINQQRNLRHTASVGRLSENTSVGNMDMSVEPQLQKLQNINKQMVDEMNEGFKGIQKREQDSVNIQLQKNNLNSEQLIKDLKPEAVEEMVKQKKERIKGKISFSSNHVMPVEKTKQIIKKQNIQQQNSYNAFNMKPIGQVHSVKKDGDKKVVKE